MEGMGVVFPGGVGVVCLRLAVLIWRRKKEAKGKAEG